MKAWAWIGVGAVAVIGIAGAGGALHWFSEPQQLKRACVDATWEHLVAPSTAQLASFRVSPFGARSVISDGLQADVDAARAKLAEVSQAHEKAGEVPDNPTGYAKILLGSMERRYALSLEKDAATQRLAEAERNKAAHDAKGLSEVVLALDAQNRASAMLRMTAVCTFRTDAGGHADIRTVEMAALDQR